MSWTAVRVTDEALLKRCVAIVAEASPFAAPLDVPSLQAGIAHGQMYWFYYEGETYEVTLELVYRPRRQRFLVCANFVGDVDPQTVVDLVVAQGEEFLAARQQATAYAIRPLGIPPLPITQFYDVLAHSDKLRVTTVAQTSDALVWQLDAVTQPVG